MTPRRNTRQRQIVFDAVQALHCHPTASQVYEHVHAHDEKISLGTVYRNLNLLAEDGSILAVKTGDGCHYDFRIDNHCHIICNTCGSVCDAEVPYDDNLDACVSSMTGYRVHSHNTVFEGVCPQCQGVKHD